MRVKDLRAIFERKKSPIPFVDCGYLGWDDPELSEKILTVHLDADTDLATRKRETVMTECAFLDGLIRSTVGDKARVLDFTCGPGFYTTELTRRGYAVTGVDYSPASIRYAKQMAKENGLPIQYHLADVREIDFAPESFDAVTFIYGQPNAFTKEEMAALLNKLYRWLAPGGMLIAELSSIDYLRKDINTQWTSFDSSFVLDKPQLWLDEKIWNEEQKSQAYRVYVIDIETGQVHELCVSSQAYEMEEYKALLASNGFETREIFDGLSGDPALRSSDFHTFFAVKEG